MVNWKRFIFVIVLIVGISHLSFLPSFAQDSKTENINLLIQEAIENNPQIQAAYNTWRAAEHKVTQVKSLPDPMARFTYFGENVETRVGPQEYKYGASQKIPFPGKLGLKGKAQSKTAQILEEKYQAITREVIKNIKFTYFDIFWVDRAVQITEEEKAILENLEKVAQRKYEANLTPQQDVIKAQVELSKLIDKLLIFRQNRKSLVAKLNSILNRPKDTEFGNIKESQLQDFNYDLNQLHEIAKESRQELQEAQLAIERAKYEKSLANLSYFPDFTLGFDYIEVGSGSTTRPNDGQDAWMGTVAINVPIWFNKLGEQVKEKKATLEASKQNYENAENVVTYEVEDVYFKLTTYKDIITLYKTALIPQTEQAFQAAKTGYETGKVDFLNWLDAERVLLMTRLAYYKAIVDYEKSVAYLERVVGQDL